MSIGRENRDTRSFVERARIRWAERLGAYVTMNPILCRSLRRRMALATICTVPLVWLLTASAGQTSGAPADFVKAVHTMTLSASQQSDALPAISTPRIARLGITYSF